MEEVRRTHAVLLPERGLLHVEEAALRLIVEELVLVVGRVQGVASPDALRHFIIISS